MEQINSETLIGFRDFMSTVPLLFWVGRLITTTNACLQRRCTLPVLEGVFEGACGQVEQTLKLVPFDDWILRGQGAAAGATAPPAAFATALIHSSQQGTSRVIPPKESINH